MSVTNGFAIWNLWQKEGVVNDKVTTYIPFEKQLFFFYWVLDKYDPPGVGPLGLID